MKHLLLCLVWFSFLNNAIALAQTNLSRSLPTRHSMPPMEFPTRHFAPSQDETIIDEPAGSPLNKINLFELPQMGHDPKKLSIHIGKPVRVDQFSFDNLLDGLIYDFQQKDDMRVEFGGPGLGAWELTPEDVKYDVPFCLLILLNKTF